MMLRIVKNRLSFFNPKNASFPFFVHISSSSEASDIQKPPLKSSLMAEFLINSCGLSSQKAVTASKSISNATTIEQADSVRHFFKQLGFDDAHIRKLICNHPRILSANIEKTLQPNLETLFDMGFEEAELKVLIASNPSVVANSLGIPRLKFWETLIGSDNKKDLVRIFNQNQGLISHAILSGITPKIALLKEHGFSNSDIASLMKERGCVMLRSYNMIEALLKLTNEIGFDIKSSLMIVKGLASISNVGTRAFAKKMEFFKGFGWSEQQFLDSFKRAPCVIHLKEKTIQEKMEFLVASVGCSQSYISSRPVLLVLSLKKRLKPRHLVMEILKENKLLLREFDLFTIMCLSDKKFIERYIVPYEKEVPKIQEIFVAACANQCYFE